MLVILSVLVILGIVVAVIVTREDSGGVGADDGDGHDTLRRVFVYSLALLGAVITASGLSGLLRVAFETFASATMVRETDRGLALGLSLTVVGLPVWALAWRAASQEAGRSLAERRSLGRRLHLAAVRLVALAVAVPYAIQVGLWVVGAEPYDPSAVARLLVWTGLWLFYERVAREIVFGSSHTRRVDRIEVYVAASAGFVLVGFSLASILSRSLGVLYEAAVGGAFLVDTGLGIGLRPALVTLVVGAALWAWHWLAVAGRDVGSTGWHVYVFLVGVLSGATTAVVSASVLLHRLLVWLLDAAQDPARVHFDVLPDAVAALALGLVAWGYHRAVLREADTGDEEAWSAPERAYRYLVTAAGMFTAAAGITIVLVVGFDLVVPGTTLVDAPGGIRDVVAAGVTLLTVGVPLWAVFWSRAQRHVRRHPEERTELARRALIFGAFGVAVVVAVVALSVLLLELFDAVLTGELSWKLVENERWSLALLLSAGAVAAHYGLVLREDRQAAPEPSRSERLREVVVVAPSGADLAERLDDRVDATVTVWARADVTGDAAPAGVVESVAGALATVTSRRALVVIDADWTVRVVALRA